MPRTASRPAPPAARAAVAPFAWQGWRLDVPSRWSPVKLEGDHGRGLALFADLHRARLGLRWSTPKRAGRGRAFDAAAWVAQAMRQEVGSAAAAEAVPCDAPAGGGWLTSSLYTDREPPGRDVWIGYSATTGRVLQLVYHAQRSERTLPDSLLPTLLDQSPDHPVLWSVFELRCEVPPGLTLTSHQLNAGDLGLRFAGKRVEVAVRQVAVAELALGRMPLDQWLVQQQRTRQRHYRSAGDAEPVRIERGGRVVTGSIARQVRRRRFCWMRHLPPALVTCALHDVGRDRLVFGQGSSESVVRAVVESVGQVAEGE